MIFDKDHVGIPLKLSLTRRERFLFCGILAQDHVSPSRMKELRRTLARIIAEVEQQTPPYHQ